MMKNVLGQNEITSLASLIGSVVEFSTGWNLGEFLDSNRIILDTKVGPIEFEGVVVEREFQGFPDEYFKLNILKPRDAEVTKCIESSGVYGQMAGRTIAKIELRYETVGLVDSGVPKWEYEVSTGVLITLNQGFIFVYALAHNAEVMRIQFAEDRKSLDLSPTVGDWEAEVGHEYTFSEKWVEVSQA